MSHDVPLPSIPDEEAFSTLLRAGVAMVLTDPSLPDNPIVYVNDAFSRVTGYERSAVIGRNCRFLQGPGTDPDHVRLLREAIVAGREITVDLLNYRADGRPFRNRLLIAPVHDPEGAITHFLGIQKALSEEEARRAANASPDHALREVQHRVKNHLAMIVGLIRLHARQGTGDPDTLVRRVESLQFLYEELSAAGFASRGERLPLDAYLSRVVNAVAHLDGRAGLSVQFRAPRTLASVDVAARLGLLLSEIVTNALEHAFEGRDGGTIDVRLEAGEDGALRLLVADDGRGLPDGTTWPDMGSMGGRIALQLIEGLSGRLSVESGPGGTRVALDVPAGIGDDPPQFA
ncbi:PAS domain-containing protein [Rubellimicrobium sp. CFH 75288]|uniref:PAS domain-containing protein n=1 Tax=Rubellimicrobium sp. CFH 75288 TaxID=2697034 RepID=UPI001412F3CB|nr:PAS domain-containing protein [Rubellimicrobium sp. CFH 75288]NAZ35616.1 PAS domain-containing protein [Rubellimicrobium sp. CFH 75288]